jgi:hypothetical protein
MAGTSSRIWTSSWASFRWAGRTARDEQHRSYRGFNFFAAGDLAVLLALLRGEYHISGLSNRLLQRVLTGKKGGQISRVLKRLRLHGVTVHSLGAQRSENLIEIK